MPSLFDYSKSDSSGYDYIVSFNPKSENNSTTNDKIQVYHIKHTSGYSYLDKTVTLTQYKKTEPTKCTISANVYNNNVFATSSIPMDSSIIIDAEIWFHYGSAYPTNTTLEISVGESVSDYYNLAGSDEIGEVNISENTYHGEYIITYESWMIGG